MTSTLINKSFCVCIVTRPAGLISDFGSPDWAGWERFGTSVPVSHAPRVHHLYHLVQFVSVFFTPKKC